ncbi:zinc-ribbon domain-containing protein [Yonghaparkia sp. Soil809]|uniref:zinc-ribbon domain-containing protein n=1 Tax=Yonghaparkia sp. Soil809 TaxID=1736417 RepID=UPI0007018CA3|nr:zinc-ribbon domain-containing protein [Yonghaparkia sp. Soil809]KRF31197.1 hypothetical protein ASG83_10360 [Yonghaparkia sp. Soil809]
MPESVEQWWARRQWTTGREVPYPIGRYRDAWAPFAMLVEQFRPDRNRALLLSQVPPAAEVWLVWVCAIGHEFVATPAEQRARPGRSRSNRSWCPICSVPGFLPAGGKWPRPATAAAPSASPVTPPPARRPPRHVPATAAALPTVRAADVAVGRAFRSAIAPRATSASEGAVRAAIEARLAVDLTPNAVRIRTPFFDRLEVWPDIVIPELAVAIELDTIGRNADEHIGRRESVDRRKDRLLREVGWEVVRLRIRPLRPLGPFDLVVPGVSQRAIDALVDRVAEARSPLFVDAYRRAGDVGGRA